ncbi:MAG: hypothetical protein O3B13_06165 [Planctomycetota bacterium]|nr:hypothetical protein [Planctomycetota bacterium]MDA1162665.1 hypothetical protein [Planctomycetota bacterium]
MLNQMLFDNPLLVRHVRSRLRSPQPGYLTVVVVLLASCLMWAGYAADGLDQPVIFCLFFGCQCLTLHLAGTSQVASSISASSDSGILDFHRVSPLSSLTTTMGFVLGAPIREYLVALLLLPFTLVSAVLCDVGITGFLTSGIVLISTTMLFHSLAITAGLLATRGKTRNINMGLGFIVVTSSFASFQVFAGLPIPGLLTAGPALLEAIHVNGPRGAVPLTFFGISLPLFVQSLLYQIPLTIFLFVAAVRRMRSAQAMLYSKSTAIAFLASIAALNLGGIIGHPQLQAAWLVPMLAYMEFIVASLLILAITPSQGLYHNCVRRSRRIGMARPPLWHDDSSNRAAVFVMAGLLLASVQIIQTLVPAMKIDDRFWRIAGTATAVVTYLGLASQYFFLKFGRRGKLVLMMFLFLFWLMPLIFAALASPAFGADAAIVIASLSPLFGIGSGSWLALIFAGSMAAVFFVLLLLEERNVWDKLGGRKHAWEDDDLTDQASNPFLQ